MRVLVSGHASLVTCLPCLWSRVSLVTRVLMSPQLQQGVKAGRLLKEAHQENSGLQVAQQLAEQRQKQAEKKSVRLEERVGALHRLLREVVPEALAT